MYKFSKGFTLIELLVVISIIAILVTVVLIAIDPISIVQQSTDGRKRTELNQVKISLQLYFNDNKDYPNALSDLVPAYTRGLPTGYTISYTRLGATDYYAFIDLDKPQPAGDDSGTRTRCGAPAGGDYYICPD